MNRAKSVETATKEFVEAFAKLPEAFRDALIRDFLNKARGTQAEKLAEALDILGYAIDLQEFANMKDKDKVRHE